MFDYSCTGIVLPQVHDLKSRLLFFSIISHVLKTWSPGCGAVGSWYTIWEIGPGEGCRSQEYDFEGDVGILPLPVSGYPDTEKLRATVMDWNLPNFEPKNKLFIIFILLKINPLLLINLYYWIELSVVTVAESQLTQVTMGWTPRVHFSQTCRQCWCCSLLKYIFGSLVHKHEDIRALNYKKRMFL